jgi:hypothetical protein
VEGNRQGHGQQPEEEPEESRERHQETDQQISPQIGGRDLKIQTTAKIKFDKDDQLVIESYGNQYVQLSNVRKFK